MPGQQRRLLLGLLMLYAPEPVGLPRIVAAICPDRSVADAKPALHVQIHRLRRLLEQPGSPGEPVLSTCDGGYALRIEALTVDVRDFRCQVDRGLRLVGEGRHGAGSALLRQATTLWAGDPFGAAYPRVGRWPEVRELVEVRQRALEALFDAELALGRHVDLVAEIQEAVDRYPARERLREHLMVALYRSGRQVEAGECYRAYRSWKNATTGLEPAPRLVELHRAVLRHDPSLRAAEASTQGVHTAPVRSALLSAAAFAEQMGGHGQVVESLRLLVTGLGSDDPERARLLLRLAGARARTAVGAGTEEADEALRLFTADGDRLGIIETELTRARIAWCASRHGAARQSLTRARQLMAALPGGPPPGSLMTSAVGLLAVTGEPAAALDLADAALRNDRHRATGWENARLLTNRGLARQRLGDPGALTDHRSAVARHEEAAGWVGVSLLVNVMDAAARLGDLGEHRRTLDRADAMARIRGSSLDLRYLDAARAWKEFWANDLTAAGRRVRRWLNADDDHFLTDRCLCLDARLRLIAGDHDGAGRVAERMLDRLGRASLRDVTVTAPVIAAALAVRRDRPDRSVGELVEQALTAVGSGFLPSELGVELPYAMRACGMPPSALEAIAASPWRDAARAYLRGDGRTAAHLYVRIGSRPDATAATGTRSGLGR
ncbi:hypothetical protein MRQ36_28720 [Micromonospora sp. R77]|uniref:AfsR/SARP family transcriptional regulator n=1 Tax=Micromonospora sp. R77 TaxID=2925836 RepID=UPI001F608600|nr:AfsR/SARP family transcriptional regulator [Micromonospora sp. R77]MCI4066321.1 hypothetical protein [Micromonospora sp. R77]